MGPRKITVLPMSTRGFCSVVLLLVAALMLPKVGWSQFVDFSAKSAAGERGIDNKRKGQSGAGKVTVTREPAVVVEVRRVGEGTADLTLEVFFFSKEIGGKGFEIYCARSVKLPEELAMKLEVKADPLTATTTHKIRKELDSSGEIDNKYSSEKSGEEFAGWVARLSRGGELYKVVSSSSGMLTYLRSNPKEAEAVLKQVDAEQYRVRDDRVPRSQ